MARPHAQVVVVEDDRDIREAVKEVLELEGFEVLAYSNGKDALEGLKDKVQPCLILLDLMMPVMNGWEFLEARKSRGDQITAVPVVIVSAFGDATKRPESVSGYIKKPVDVEVLLKIVEKHCQRVR